MAVKIVVIDQKTKKIVRDQVFDQSLITFGRSKSCHVELEHPDLSRRHFIVRFATVEYLVMDEGSRHGTMIDGAEAKKLKSYPVGKHREIIVPGFKILIDSDGESPKVERTKVVARNLLDELLRGEIEHDQCRFIRSSDDRYHFTFVEEKTVFVMGTMPQADFVIDGGGAQKKHLLFLQDINGIRVVPHRGHKVVVNDQVVDKSAYLEHGSRLSAGSVDFIFYDHPDYELEEKIRAKNKLEPITNSTEKAGGSSSEGAKNAPVAQVRHLNPDILRTFDWLFALASAAVLIGMLRMLLKLI